MTNLILQLVTMINPIKGLFEINPYNDKKVRTITNLVETTWLTRYPWPTQITYDQESQFIGNELKDNLIKD